MTPTPIGIVGTGYVCDMYLASLAHHPDLELVGVHDRDTSRGQRVAAGQGVRCFDSLDELLADDSIEIVVNLTNPDSHFAVSHAALMADKHVYSEKPLATDFEEAGQLVELARARGLELSGAPCSLLGETAQTIWRELRAGKIGVARVVYAELDDGPIHLLPVESWRSQSGFGWPYQDEFRVGCTVEHAGYYLGWLTAFFGPVRTMTSFSAELIPAKPGTPPGAGAPDFSVGCLEFDDGVVVRLTNSILAPENHTLTIVGDEGVLRVEECWDYRSPVRFSKHALRPKIARFSLVSRALGYGPTPLELVEVPRYRDQHKTLEMMDYCRGISALARAVGSDRTPLLSAEQALHITEITLTLQHPEIMGSPRVLTSTFERSEPPHPATL